jgi:hypothetical protein
MSDRKSNFITTCYNLNDPADALQARGAEHGWNACELEWQAKVQGLVEALEKISQRYNQWKDAGHHCESKKALQSVTDISSKALAAFHSNEPSDHVMVPKSFMDRIKELGQAMPPNAVSMEIQKAIKGIGKDK